MREASDHQAGLFMHKSRKKTRLQAPCFAFEGAPSTFRPCLFDRFMAFFGFIDRIFR